MSVSRQILPILSVHYTLFLLFFFCYVNPRAKIKVLRYSCPIFRIISGQNLLLYFNLPVSTSFPLESAWISMDAWAKLKIVELYAHGAQTDEILRHRILCLRRVTLRGIILSATVQFPQSVFWLYGSLRFHTIKKESGKNQTLRRGRGNRTPVNGFGDRRTTAVLFLYWLKQYCFNRWYYSTSPSG